MKRVFATIGQVLLFLFADAVGSLFYHPFQVQTTLSGDPLAPRSFIWDGLVIMFLVYLIVIMIELLRKRVRQSAPWTTLALALAGSAGFLLKFGFVTHNW